MKKLRNDFRTGAGSIKKALEELTEEQESNDKLQ